ncbi:DUF542 domain-containing protein [bacterium]|nr:DUF542 domain-containing protein [bacterium]
MTVDFNTQTTLAELATGRELVSRLLTQLGLDFCCGGQQSLAEACSAAGLDAPTLLRVLQGVAIMELPTTSDERVDLEKLSLSELCDHIEQRYHRWLRDELPRMDGLLELLDEKHSGQWPWITALRQHFEQMERDLDRHLRHEEQSVFPAIRELEATASKGAHSTLLDFEMQQLEAEHEHSGRQLAQLRELGQSFIEPSGACSSTRRLIADLREFERQMHQHVHCENYILFGRVRQRLAEL